VASSHKWFDPQSDPITSVNDMLHIVKSLEAQYHRPGNKPPLYFRGVHHDKYGLLPSVGRESEFIGMRSGFDIISERDLLHRFRRHAYGELQGRLNDWGLLLLARHHHLPVRLLDWTSSPLVALYFAAAFHKKEERSGAALWAFVGKGPPFHHLDILLEEQRNDANTDDYYGCGSELDTDVQKRTQGRHTIEFLQSPLRLKGVRIVYPFDVSPRIVNQNGVFTIQENPREDLEKLETRANWDSLMSNDLIDIETIFKWYVPAWARPRIVVELQRHNIDYRTLFPELDGIAEGLWHTEVIRQN
jgi:hypothetical protein